MRLPWRIALYCVTTAVAGCYFLLLNATTLAVPRDHYLDFGFPFHYIELGGFDHRRAWLWPGVIGDLVLILLAGFALAQGISWLTSRFAKMISKRRTFAHLPDVMWKS